MSVCGACRTRENNANVGGGGGGGGVPRGKAVQMWRKKGGRDIASLVVV